MGEVLALRTGLTFVIRFPTGDQEQQDSSSFGCAGCQPHPGSAAAGAATGRPPGLCQHEGGGLGQNVQIVRATAERAERDVGSPMG